MCFETNFEEAAQRKSAKYVDLVEQAQARGYKAEPSGWLSWSTRLSETQSITLTAIKSLR